MKNSKPILLKSLIDRPRTVHPLFENIKKITPDRIDIVDKEAKSGGFLVYLEDTSSGPQRWAQISAKLKPIKANLHINDGVPKEVNGQPWTKSYSPAFDPKEEKPLEKQSFIKKFAKAINIFKEETPLPQIRVSIETSYGNERGCELEYRPELGEFRGAMGDGTRTDQWYCTIPAEAQKLAQAVASDPAVKEAFKDVPGGIQSKITKETFTQAITYVV